MKKKYLSTIIALIVLAISCKKDNSIGANLLPSDDLLNAKFSDTFSLNVKTIGDTFLRTDKLSKNYLGVINDAQFGFQKASIVMELDRPTSVFDDTLGPFVIDSVVLFLKYNFIYGDTLTPQSFTVSTIENKINETQAYYSNNTDFAAGTFLGNLDNYLYTPTRNPVSTTTTDTTGVVGLMRIKLDNSVIQTRIMNLTQSIKRDSSLFKNAFNGIRIENSNTNGKAMAEIDLNSTFTNITIFYKDKNLKAQVSKLFPNLFRVANGTIVQQTNSINLFNNNLNTTVQNTISSGVQNDSINYMLAQGGTLIKVSLPTLANLGKVAVNKAILQVTQIIPNSDLSFLTPVPKSFFLEKRNNDGYIDHLSTYNLFTEFSSLSQFLENSSYIDSVFIDGSGNKLVRYTFIITQYLQRVLNGDELNSDIYLKTYYYPGLDGNKNLINDYFQRYLPVRAIFAGSNYSDVRYKMKFNITYTEIE